VVQSFSLNPLGSVHFDKAVNMIKLRVSETQRTNTLLYDQKSGRENLDGGRTAPVDDAFQNYSFARRRREKLDLTRASQESTTLPEDEALPVPDIDLSWLAPSSGVNITAVASMGISTALLNLWLGGDTQSALGLGIGVSYLTVTNNPAGDILRALGLVIYDGSFSLYQYLREQLGEGSVDTNLQDYLIDQRSSSAASSKKESLYATQETVIASAVTTYLSAAFLGVDTKVSALLGLGSAYSAANMENSAGVVGRWAGDLGFALFVFGRDIFTQARKEMTSNIVTDYAKKSLAANVQPTRQTNSGAMRKPHPSPVSKTKPSTFTVASTDSSASSLKPSTDFPSVSGGSFFFASIVEAEPVRDVGSEPVSVVKAEPTEYVETESTISTETEENVPENDGLETRAPISDDQEQIISDALESLSAALNEDGETREDVIMEAADRINEALAGNVPALKESESPSTLGSPQEELDWKRVSGFDSYNSETSDLSTTMANTRTSNVALSDAQARLFAKNFATTAKSESLVPPESETDQHLSMATHHVKEEEEEESVQPKESRLNVYEMTEARSRKGIILPKPHLPAAKQMSHEVEKDTGRELESILVDPVLPSKPSKLARFEASEALGMLAADARPSRNHVLAKQGSGSSTSDPAATKPAPKRSKLILLEGTEARMRGLSKMTLRSTRSATKVVGSSSYDAKTERNCLDNTSEGLGHKTKKRILVQFEASEARSRLNSYEKKILEEASNNDTPPNDRSTSNVLKFPRLSSFELSEAEGRLFPSRSDKTRHPHGMEDSTTGESIGNVLRTAKYDSSDAKARLQTRPSKHTESGVSRVSMFERSAAATKLGNNMEETYFKRVSGFANDDTETEKQSSSIKIGNAASRLSAFELADAQARIRARERSESLIFMPTRKTFAARSDKSALSLFETSEARFRLLSGFQSTYDPPKALDQSAAQPFAEKQELRSSPALIDQTVGETALDSKSITDTQKNTRIEEGRVVANPNPLDSNLKPESYTLYVGNLHRGKLDNFV